MGNVLKLPRTAKGRAHLRQCVRLAGGWDFPDSTNAADFDWDTAAIEAESERKGNKEGDK